MLLSLFLVFGATYFLLGMAAAIPASERAHQTANIIIVVGGMIAAVMIALPALR